MSRCQSSQTVWPPWDLMGDMMVGAGRQAVTHPGSYRPGGRDRKLQRGTKPDMVTNFRQDLGVT